MNTRTLEQKLSEMATKIQALQQQLMDKKKTSDILVDKLKSSFEIKGLNLSELEHQFSKINVEKAQVIQFNDDLAKLLSLNENEVLAWKQASTAQYDQTTTAYILSARSFASSYIPLSSYVGSAVRYVAGNTIAGSNVSPTYVMEKISEMVRQQKVIQKFKTEQLKETQEIHSLESEIATLQQQSKQVDIEIHQIKEEEQRMAKLTAEQKENELKSSQTIQLPPSKEAEESRSGITPKQKLEIQTPKPQQQVQNTQFSEEAIYRISLAEQKEKPRKQNTPEDEHRVNAGLGGLIGFAVGMIAGGFVGFALAVPTLGFSILLGPLLGAVAGVIIGVKIGYAISERLSNQHTLATTHTDTPPNTPTGTTTHAKLTPQLQVDRKMDTKQCNAAEPTKHTEIIKKNKESKSVSVADITNATKPSLRL